MAIRDRSQIRFTNPEAKTDAVVDAVLNYLRNYPDKEIIEEVVVKCTPKALYANPALNTYCICISLT